MEIIDLSWNEHLKGTHNSPLLPTSIRGLIVGKSGCGKTTITELTLKTWMAR
jgi:ABC-type transport system involved in cytochrome bd biosynthesis fused ATPase/permease subunit